jgi:hypothetical protein
MTLEEFDNHLAWKDANNGGAERTMLQNEMRMTLIEKLRWLEEAEIFSIQLPIYRHRAIAEIRLPTENTNRQGALSLTRRAKPS